MALPAVYPSKPPYPPNSLKRPDAMVSKHNASSDAPGSTSMSLQQLEMTAENNTNNDDPALLVEWSFTMDAVTGRWCRRIVNKEGLQKNIVDSRLEDDIDLTETSTSEAPEIGAQWTFYQHIDPIRWIPQTSKDEDFEFTARLRPGQVRLLNLALDDSDTIYTAIATFDLHTAPSFIAISYVCGADECEHELFVNGQRFKTKRNLLAALKDMKRLLREGMLKSSGSTAPVPCIEMWIWADAICINQEDIVEKAAQVRAMHEVYRKALVVTVSLYDRTLQGERLARLCSWLEGKKDVCAIGSRIKQNTFPHETFKEWPHSMRRSSADQLEVERVVTQTYRLSIEDVTALLQTAIARHEGTICPPTFMNNNLRISSLLWSDCLDIFQHEWFSRVWTCQEARLGISGNGAGIFLGTRCVRWVTLSSLYMVTVLAADVRKIEGTLSDVARVRKRLWDLHTVTPMRELYTDNLLDDIWHLLVTTTQRRATQGKDHIYAMLGLMPRDIRDRLEPDYTLTDAEVFAKTLLSAMALADGAKGLPSLWEQLSFVTASTVGLPSWCPDFSNEGRARAIVFSNKTLSPKVVQHFENRGALSWGSPSDGIEVRAMVVDSIATVLSEPCPPSPSFTDIAPELIDRQKDWLLRLHGCFACSERLADGFGAKLDDFLYSFHEPQYQAPLCSCFCFGAFLSLDRGYNPFEIASGAQSQLRNSQPIGNHDMTSVTNEGHPVRSSCSHAHESYHRYLTTNIVTWTAMIGNTYVFKTAAGRYGYSPRLPSPGDRICLVPGGQLLHIISASETTRYKGAASVHGLMDDNLLNTVQDSEERFEDITLH